MRALGRAFLALALYGLPLFGVVMCVSVGAWLGVGTAAWALYEGHRLYTWERQP